MNKKYIVRLTVAERAQLTELVNKNQAAAYKIKHANVLLKVDADGPNWSDAQAAEAFSCAPRNRVHVAPTLCGARDRGGPGTQAAWTAPTRTDSR